MGILGRVSDALLGGATHLKVGDPAPDWGVEAPPEEGIINLEDLRGKWVVLYFYPKADTPGCTKQACSIRDSRDLLDAGVALYGASTDFADSQRAFQSKYNLPFPLLADARGDVARRYGVLMRPKIARRVTFVIDPAGIIRHILRDIDTVRHADQVLDILRQLGAFDA